MKGTRGSYSPNHHIYLVNTDITSCIERYCINIPHEDIVTLYNNPYLNTISNWSNIPIQQKKVINKEYPEIDRLSIKYQEVKRDWGEAILNVLKGTNEVLDTIKRVLDNPVIDCCIVATAVATSITCPPLGGVAVPACTAVLTRKAVAKLAPTAGLLLTREIGREIGKDATELQREFDILYNKKHNNNGNKGNNANSHQPANNPKPRVQTTWEDILNFWGKIKTGKLTPFRGGWKGAEVLEEYTLKDGTKIKKGYILSRDKLHNELELFKDKNNHLGAIDPKGECLYKPGIKGRKLSGL